MKRYVEKFVILYIDQVCDDLELLLKQKVFCIFDVFKVYEDKELFLYMEEKGIKVIFVFVVCIDRF